MNRPSLTINLDLDDHPNPARFATLSLQLGEEVVESNRIDIATAEATASALNRAFGHAIEVRRSPDCMIE